MVLAPPRPDSESELLEAARQGCPDAFGALYLAHHDLATRVARRVLAPHGLAHTEDAVHMAFMAVFRALQSGRGPVDQLRPYLITAVRRHAVRLLRRQEHGSRAFLAGEEPVAISHELGEAAEVSHSMLRDVLDQLPPRMQRVLWATEVEGRGAGEVAADLGVTPGDVSVARYRARRRLVTTYLEAYRRQAEARCQPFIDDLGNALLASRSGLGREAPVEVRGHVGTCARCRDLLRGVDLQAS